MDDRDAITKAVDALRKIEQSGGGSTTGDGHAECKEIAAEALAALTALQPSPARDYGKMMKPPADATHCGGYPVNPAREETEALVNGYGTLEDDELRPWIEDQIIPFILGEKS